MNQVLDFAISMITIFIMLSMVVSGLTEYWCSRIGKNSRASLLFESLLKVFNDRHNRNFLEPIYRHPLVENSKPTEDDLPAYLDPKTISSVLIEVIIRDAIPHQVTYDNLGKPIIKEAALDHLETFTLFENSVAQLRPSDLKQLLQSFIHNSKDLKSLRDAIEIWYSNYMDRVSGWYKKRLKKPLFFTALVVTIFINADIFRISKEIWTNDLLREQLVQQSQILIRDSTFIEEFENKSVADKKEYVDSIYTTLKLKEIPLGWKSEFSGSDEKLSLKYMRDAVKANFSEFGSLSTLFGWILMAFALHMGAPFWFETLVKVTNIRGAGVKPIPNK